MKMEPEGRIKFIVHFSNQLKFWSCMHAIGITVNVVSETYWMAAFYFGPVCGVIGTRKLNLQVLDGFGAFLLLNAFVNVLPLIFGMAVWIVMTSVIFIAVYVVIYKKLKLFKKLVKVLTSAELEAAVEIQACRSKSRQGHFPTRQIFDRQLAVSSGGPPADDGNPLPDDDTVDSVPVLH
jgi:hypothetical protein